MEPTVIPVKNGSIQGKFRGNNLEDLESSSSIIDGTCIAYERGKSEAQVALTEHVSSSSLSSASHNLGGTNELEETASNDGISAVPVCDLVAVSDVSVKLVAKSFGLTDEVLKALLTMLQATSNTVIKSRLTPNQAWRRVRTITITRNLLNWGSI